MEFSFFLLLITIFFGIVYRVLLVLLKALFGKKRIGLVSNFRKSFFWINTIVIFAVLTTVCWFYLPNADKIWIAVSSWFGDVLLKTRLLNTTRLMDVFYVGYFFRLYYPVILAFILFVGLYRALDKNRCSFWYRFYHWFDQRMVFLLVFSWLLFVGIEAAGWTVKFMNLRVMALNAALYFSTLYVFYGFLILLYGLKRNHLPYWLSLILIYGLLVLSGQVFIVTAALIMGVGITDIWMNYRKFYYKKTRHNFS